MIRFGVIGTGWRTRFFDKLARVRPDLFTLVGIVTRDVARAAAETPAYHAPLLASLDELLALKPLFVVTSVPWSVNPGMLHMLADKGIPALSETPPAPDLDGMIGLWRRVEQGAKIAVAEQYHLQPQHAARIAYARSGALGTVTQAQVSVAHGYHGVSLIRRLLDIGSDSVTITATKFTSPILKSPDRHGAPDAEQVVSSEQALAWLHFEGGKLGVFDFTSDQYFSYIRGQRICVRGERGEMTDHQAVILQDQATPVRIPFVRHETGAHGNLEGHYLKGIQAGERWIYHNPVAPADLSDEEIAVGAQLLKMADYADGGACFYPLAEGCQDRYLDMCIWQAVDSGSPVQTTRQPWAW